jgi:hypothetical protein
LKFGTVLTALLRIDHAHPPAEFPNDAVEIDGLAGSGMGQTDVRMAAL